MLPSAIVGTITKPKYAGSYNARAASTVSQGAKMGGGSSRDDRARVEQSQQLSEQGGSARQRAQKQGPAVQAVACNSTSC